MATASASDATRWRRSGGAAVALVVLLSFVVLLQGFPRDRSSSTASLDMPPKSSAGARQHVDNEALAECPHPVVGTMFPPWPLFQEHYAWQLEAKCHAGGGGGVGVGGRGGNPRTQRCQTNLTAALMRYYVDEFAKQLLQRTHSVNARDEVIVSPFPGQPGWVTLGDSMQTEARLANVRHLLVDAAHRGLSGNFLEAGVWRGGGSLYARMIQTYFTNPHSHVFVCDSFEGLPPARDERHAWENYYAKWRYLSVPLDKVQGIFKRYGLDDPQHVHFFQGFFNESMPRVRAELLRSGQKLSVLRLDGDMYESTIDILYQLYDLVEVGGWIIIDDWNWNEKNLKRPLFGALPASLDFRRLHGIEDSEHGMIDIDGVGAFWRKAREVHLLRDRYPDRVYPDAPVTVKDFAALRDRWNRERPKPWPPAHCW